MNILYSLPDGAQRNVLLCTDLFEYITSLSGVNWTFITPFGDDPLVMAAFIEAGAAILPWPSQAISFHDRQIQFLLQEMWKVQVNDETTRIFARRMRWAEPKRYHYHRRAAYFLHHLPGSERLLNWAGQHFSDRAWETVLHQVSPDAVILGSGATKLSEYPLGRAAHRRGIPCFGIIPSWDNLTTKGHLPVRCEKLAVWCDHMRREAVALHDYDPENIIITGPPLFDFHQTVQCDRATFCSELDLEVDKKVITYTSVPESSCPWSFRYAEMLAQMIAENSFDFPAQLLIRLHPQDNFEEFAGLRKRVGVHVQFPGAYRRPEQGNEAILSFHPGMSDAHRLTETLLCSDVVVNIASTITLEASGLDRPVINLAFNPPGVDGEFNIAEYYRLTHYRPVKDSGAVEMVYSEGQLRNAINDAISNPAKRSTERAALYREFDPFADGENSIRLGHAIGQFVEGCGSWRPHVGDSDGQLSQFWGCRVNSRELRVSA